MDQALNDPAKMSALGVLDPGSRPSDVRRKGFVVTAGRQSDHVGAHRLADVMTFRARLLALSMSRYGAERLVQRARTARLLIQASFARWSLRQEYPASYQLNRAVSK
jgi:hypothetical protein